MNWRRWIRPGLVAILLVAVAAILVESGDIGRDVAERVSARLAAEGQGWASVEASARNVTVRGTAPSVEAQQLAVNSAAGVRGVRSVLDRTDLLPIASPYIWSGKRAGRVVTLSGSVPSEGQRVSVLAATRRALPEAEILDDQALARGAPASFNAAIAFALARLADLADGVVTLTDDTLAVSGVASSAAAYAAARTAFATGLPPTVVLGPVDVLPARADPFVWSADYDGEAVSIAGFVPNDVVRESLVAVAAAVLPETPVTESAVVASGEPPGFAEAATFALQTLTYVSRGGVTLDGLALDIAGVAKTVDDYEALLARLAGPLPDGLRVVSGEVTPATVSPYQWRGEKADGSVVLVGYVPSAEARAEVAAVAAALFGEATVDNRVRVAAGEPRLDWLGAIKFALGELALLGHGSVELDGATFVVEGEAATSEGYVSIVETNARTLPASLELARAEVTPPRASPYRFAVERRPGSVAMSGHVPSPDDRRSIQAAARRKVGGAAIDDALVFASGAPDGFVDATETALQAVARLSGGRVDLVDGVVRVEGFAFDAAAAAAIGPGLEASLPDGFAASAVSVIARQPQQPVSPDRCRDLLQEVLANGGIVFEGGRTEMPSDSLGSLDRVASVLSRCPESTVEIGAHTDSDGSASRNRDRTQARAEAIAEHLVTAGVRRERLSAVGYGESEPIADNGTEQGKAANRRIEFSIAQPGGG